MKSFYLLLFSLFLCSCGSDQPGSSSNNAVAAPVNHAPVAVAGQNQSVAVADTVTLDGRQSIDQDGDILSYEWEIISKPLGSASELSNYLLPSPTFYPDIAGEYQFKLTVHDGRLYSAPSFTTLTVAAPQSPPSIITDATGTIHLISLSVVENFRNSTNVNFSFHYSLKNTGASRYNTGTTFAGINAQNSIVFSRVFDQGIDPGQTITGYLSVGEPLTIAQYDSIKSWLATSIVIY